MSTPPDDKAARKVEAAKADDEGAYRDTPFGRRRVGKAPQWQIALPGRIAASLVRLWRWIRPRRDGD